MTYDPQLVTETEPAGSSEQPSRRPLIVLVTVLIAIGLVVLGAGWAADRVGDLLDGSSDEVTAPDVEAGLPVVIEIAEGSSARRIGELLAEGGVVSSSVGFETAVRIAGVAEQLKAGEYEFITGMGDDAAIALLMRGPDVDTFWVTVPEGLRIGEVLESISEQSGISQEVLEQVLLDGSVSTGLLPDGAPTTLQEWEGLLFPDTYEFRAEAEAGDVLQLFADTMQRRVEAVDWAGLLERGLTRYDGIIIASLIEAETRVDGERPLVSSVIENRLDLSMPLQIDATVLYAMGERGMSLTLADLEIDSPYNTYQTGGLPPTPIGAPGRASLEAAADPATTDYLYYVLTSLDGSHSFTASYDEFLQFKAQAKADGVLP